MTSTVGNNAAISTALTRDRFLRVDKEGIPLDKQVPRTSQTNSVVGPATITFDGSSTLFVTNALSGVITVNATSVSNLIGRNIRVVVRGGVGQNVVINFPAAGYPVYVKGSAGAVTTYTIAASANNQDINIEFGLASAYVTI